MSRIICEGLHIVGAAGRSEGVELFRYDELFARHKRQGLAGRDDVIRIGVASGEDAEIDVLRRRLYNGFPDEALRPVDQEVFAPAQQNDPRIIAGLRRCLELFYYRSEWMFHSFFILSHLRQIGKLAPFIL